MEASGGIPSKWVDEPTVIQLKFAPWAQLWPIGSGYGEYYDEHGFIRISQVKEDGSWCRILGKVIKIEERSLKKVMKGKFYKDEHFDKYFVVIQI